MLTRGLGAKQPTAQDIAAAQDQVKYTPFEETASPRQVQQVFQAASVKQQPSALQQIKQLIDRQSTTPKIQPINQTKNYNWIVLERVKQLFQFLLFSQKGWSIFR